MCLRLPISDPYAAQWAPKSPCPVCGKTARKLSLQIADKLDLNDEVRGVGYAESATRSLSQDGL
jgi:hypothetical protein